MCTRVQLLYVKKVILCSASFFYRIANAVNFFFLLSLSVVFFHFSFVPSWFILSTGKKRTRERANGSTTKSYIYIYLYTLGRDGGGKNDLILVLYTCALSPFYIPSGMMRKSQKEIHYCSIQVNNVNLYVILDRKKKENTHLFFFFLYMDKVLFQLKYQTYKQNKLIWTVEIIVSKRTKDKQIIHYSILSLLNSFEATIDIIILIFPWNGISYFNGSDCSS
jgi:hypothetical protein